MDAGTVTVAVGAVTQVCGLAALRMRLRWQERQMLARHRCLAQVAARLRDGDTVDEHGADGSGMRVVAGRHTNAGGRR